ncbi:MULTISPECIES: EamA family transporter [Rhizobium/Agrobacterium group]|jgi:probable blue pigment (indigoidine) exporter|uniref:EamA family transporter n=1 Tax=Agrobacterium tumefaciens TaxID=358 RepID=A0AA44F982_AGRTU|nr:MULTISPECIES: EamA family transporter [Rhizobium/Agrobacterium group]EHJ98115.1 regulator protein pecM [Agrobacterium tumefaciens 5A]NSL23301.1 EamA family transporter [Agrobacterium tumefaciens]NSZ72319.1 EamA family transporter [Agrobacterium tumefaciens]NTB88808.1 EamA family transporter [Agrobacterium tumefaciens]NTC19063.1 EamA family transporter [Agrobacterium tumefaciens]
MKKNTTYAADVLVTALAPAIWGTTYFVTTEFLPHGYPFHVAMLRALPAGVLLLLLVRKLPKGIWWSRSLILGALNFSFFWAMLFVSAYRLPGGVAATVGAIQPLIVIGLSRLFLAAPVRPLAIVAGLLGILGVALLVLAPGAAALDAVGVAAGLAGAVSMAFGTVLTRKWRPPVSNLTFTAWQLTAGGILLLPVAYFLEPALPAPTAANILGMAYLGIIGAALTYFLWFRGLARIEPSAAASLGFLSPVVATLLGWLALGQSLTPAQIVGFVAVLFSIWLSQRSQLPK